jgi:PAS domain S-box-containing protein
MVSVILVDDEAQFLDLTRLFLESDGEVEVDTCTSAGEACERLKTKQYDVIVSDFQMPGMDGIAFLKVIRARGDRTPFLIMTGKGHEQVAMEALNSGADFYLQKGGDPTTHFADLKQMISEAVERRYEREAVRETAERLADIINFLPDSTFVIDRTGRVISWNKAIEEMTGVRGEEILDRGSYEYALPFYGYRRPMLIDMILSIDLIYQNDEILRSYYTNVQRDGATFKAESEYLKPDGRRLVLWEKASPLYDHEGKVIGAIESIRDITRQKETEAALVESKERLELSLWCTEQGLWDWNLRIGEVYIRPIHEETGSSEQAGTKRSFEEFLTEVHPEDVARLRSLLTEHLQKKSTYFEAEYRYRSRTGEWKWILSRGRAVELDRDGNPVRVIGTHRDISDKKRLESSLRESEDKYHSFIRNFEGIAFRAAMDFRPLFFHGAVESISGYSEDDFISGRVRWDTLIYLEDLPAIRDSIEKISKVPNYTVDREYRIRRKDGETRWIHELIANISDPSGTPIAVQGALYDVTWQKHLEDALAEATMKLDRLESKK